MGQLVCSGALCMCTMGIGPTTLNGSPHMVSASGIPSMGANDFSPFVNIPPFPLCQSPSNPAVAAATAAALGVPTPSACTPMVSAPWSPGSPTVTIGGAPALNASSTANCSYGGTISISFAGQTTVTVP